MTVAVRFAPQALLQGEAAQKWWSEHSATPLLFEDELDRAIRILQEVPRAGAPYTHRRLTDVRRLLLRATQH
jgi:hypothetical protein